MTDARRVLDHLVHAVAEDGFDAHTVHVLLGEDEAVHHWRPDVPRDVHSVAKAVCVLAAGMADDRGLFDVDAPVADHLPDWPLGDGVRQVTTRHLLSMTSGIDLPWSPTFTTDWPDLAREFVSRPSRGRVFQYAPASTYTAMRALATAVGDVGDWLAEHLFGPLGVDEVAWERCPHGHVVGASGLWLRATDLAKVGRLVRDGGAWHGRGLVSSRWTHAMASQWTQLAAPAPYDRYSLGGWGGPGSAWRLHGAHGQLVVLAGAAVVTVTADDHAGADLMAERVVQALDGAGPRSAAEVAVGAGAEQPEEQTDPGAPHQ